MKTASLNLRAGLVSLLIFICFVGAWQLPPQGRASAARQPA
jgi:hypothetical protein